MAASVLVLRPFDRIGCRGGAAAATAFAGLGLMIGAHWQDLAWAGLGFALGAACCRSAIPLIARATLQHADARLTTWYSLVSSTAIFVLAALVTSNWAPPQTALGWAALAAVSVANAVGVLALFVSTRKIGPVQTALIMNLEPLLSTVGAVVLLGQTISFLQLGGAVVMLIALGAFQMRQVGSRRA